jgi:hypothetical protein
MNPIYDMSIMGVISVGGPDVQRHEPRAASPVEMCGRHQR